MIDFARHCEHEPTSTGAVAPELAPVEIRRNGETKWNNQLLNAILHGQRLDEPLTWVYIAACVAVGIAGWKFGAVIDWYQNRGSK
ncbi:hypothetical protein ACLKMY_23810 [Paraburkholderia mimosarum]|uniref:hypothetical protein n=1 Tax=Paraburkholderia mimosarum TaxID=312026 RepID=UPI0039C48799